MQHASPPAAPCWFCGQPEVLEIGDIWTDSNFQLDTCCPALLESVSAGMDDDPDWGRELLRRLGAEALTGHRLRRVGDGQGCHPMLDWQLELRPVHFAQARAFIARHHAHCPPPVAWRFGIGVANGHQLIGVATVGNPVSRAFNGRGIVEVNRLCVRRDIAPLLCWNAASMLYGAASRAAERAGFRSIITYTHETEEGTSLRAAGWNRDGPAGGQSWHRPGRPRSTHNAYVRKVRWSRTLHPRAKPAPRPDPPPAPAAATLWIGSPASPGPCSI
jgi:hypothetical protein